MERYHIFKLGLAILFYAAYCIRPMMVNCLKIDDAVGRTNNETKNSIDEDLVYYQGVEGKPGVDFPVLSHIPRTTFNCRNVDSGYYADLETDCQVFHICEEGRKISFLCPNGTIFQQSELICEWWFKVNCTNAPSLYEESAEQLREENARRKSSRRVVANHGAVMRAEEHSSVSTSQNGRSFDVNNRASKKVDSGRRDNRINNHATSYRTSPDEDLTRASSSDLARSRGSTNKPAPFTTSSPPQRKPVQRNRQDYDYQERRGDDYQDYEDQTRKTSSRNQNQRKPVRFQQNNNDFSSNHRNQEERKPAFKEQNRNQESSSGFEEKKPVSFRNNNGFQSDRQNQYNSDFEENRQDNNARFNNRNQQRDFTTDKPVPTIEENNNNNNDYNNRQFESQNSPQENSFNQHQDESNNDQFGFNSDKPKPVSNSENTGFRQDYFSVSQPVPLSVTETSNFNNQQYHNQDNKPVSGNKNDGFQQSNRFGSQQNLRTTTERNYNNQQFGFRNSNLKPVSNDKDTGFQQDSSFNNEETNKDTGFRHNTALTNNNFNTKEPAETTERNSNYNNQRFGTEESVSRVGFQQSNKGTNSPSVTERNNQNNQRFGTGNANHKPVSDTQRTGFQQKTSFNIHNNFNAVSTTERSKVFGNQQFGLNRKSVSNDDNVSFQQNTPFSNKETGPASDTQQTEPSDQKPVSDIQNRNFQQSNKETSSPDQNNQRFGTGNANHKPVSDIQRTGFQQKTSFNIHNNFNAVSTTDSSKVFGNQQFGVNQKSVSNDDNVGFQQNAPFSNKETDPVSDTQQSSKFNDDNFSIKETNPVSVTEPSDHKPVSDIQNRNFELIRNFNEEFISNDKRPNDFSDSDREPEPTSTSFDTKVVPTASDIATDYPTTSHEDLTSTSTSSQPSTDRTLQPVPLSSGFQDQNNEASTTVSSTADSHAYREFKCPDHPSEKEVVPSSTAFPSQKQEAFNTDTQNENKKVTSVEGKDGTVKQKSTVPLTRNDIVNRRLEPTDSDEAQITEETASFYKNSFNRLDQDLKSSTSNPHPNHRETYSDLKEPKYYSNKILSAISSVTPQYLTTQPINSGRPFIGSQVGTTLRKDITSTTPRSYFTTTQPPTTSLFNIGRTDISYITKSTEGSTRTDKIVGTTRPFQASTKKTVDQATVYGKFAKSSATTPSNGKILLTLSKTLSGTSLSTSPKVQSNTVKTSAEILSTSDSSNAATPQVRLFGKVNSNTAKTPGVEIYINSNSKTSPSSRNSFSTTPKPRGKALSFGSTSPASINSLSSTAKSISFGTVSERVPTSFSYSSTTPQSLSINDVSPDGFNSFSTTPRPFGLTTTASSGVSSFSSFTKTSHEPVGTTTPSPNPFGTTFAVTTTDAPKTTPVNLNSFNTISNSRFGSFKPAAGTTVRSQVSGFYVTKNAENGPSTGKSLIGEISRPRPFDLPPEPDFRGRAVYSTTEDSVATPTPSIPTYKISSASPFKVPTTLEPTEPTPFTSKSPLPSTFENVDSMINALAEMANQNDYSSDSPRPGLVIPPSAGPQTLHTLAVYFANALDGIASDKEEEEEDEGEHEENLTTIELEKKRLTELLTQMTMSRYNELFSEEKEDEETTTVTSRSQNEDEDNDLEGQHSKSPTTTPKVRQLAKVFTQALSSYLDDPATFKKVLEEIRPTEPPATEKEETTNLADDELLNFSDTDSKSSFPPFYPTPLSARPTWGYLIAYNTSKTTDVKNSINPEENLQGADSQSFISQFNKLQNDKETTTKSSIQLPGDHWTTSPGVTKLWSSAFSFDPASINENFGTTESIATVTEQGTEAPEVHEIQYELRALPQLELNSTQVHGILIDFMNTTKLDDENRLQRILRKLNTTEDEFLAKMKEIEGNPLTRRLILLLISECGANATAEVDTQAVPVHTLLSRTIQKNKELIETSSSIAGFAARQQVEGQPVKSSSLKEIVDPSLDEDSQDARALQLLNSLYTIASRFGK